MARQNTEAKLKSLLRQEKIQLWNPPYTVDNNQPGQQQMQELAERYAPEVCVSVSEVGGALESIRAQAVTRGNGNRMYRETSMATLELLLPHENKKDPKTKTYVEMKLDVLAQELVDRIGEEYSLKHVKLILNGKTLSVERRLDEQNVKNNSKVMVLRVSYTERKRQISEEEKQKESIQRTQKGFQILSERDGSEDPETTPFLEITDQKGNLLKIPPEEKKALILAMGLHEKGRSLMKRKQHDNALCHLLQADEQFGKCGSELLDSVDNYAVLQLDIVWCYQALEALTCLDDARQRLQKAEDCFLLCYGEQRQRVLMIKGNTGREEVLFLRLYLLQSLLSYIEGNDAQARLQLLKVESLYARLHPDSEKMDQLMALGFSEREARLALRACEGNMEQAATHIIHAREEREELRQRDRQRRTRRTEDISTLMQLGFCRRDAARALQHADGDVNAAYAILADSAQPAQAANHKAEEVVSPDKVEQLLYLGFERESSEAALRLTGGDIQSAIQLLLDNQGIISLDSSSSSSSSSSSLSSEKPSTSSKSAEDNELVNEVLEDIPSHEEDYLDVTLEEENELIKKMKSYLSRGQTHTV